MSRSFQLQKRRVLTQIDDAKNQRDLHPVIDQIQLEDLQSMLTDYITTQVSASQMTSIYYGSASAPDIIGIDCLRLAFEYLEYRDISSLSGVCKTFRDLLPSFKNALIDRMLVVNPIFTEYLFSDWIGVFRIGHDLEMACSCHLSFDDIRKRGSLTEQEFIFWTICHHFKFQSKLVSWFVDDNPTVKCHEASIGQIVDCSNPNGASDPEWNVFKSPGDVDYTDNWRYLEQKLLGAVQIECPDQKWRDDFVSRNIRENIFDFLLSVHPMFAEYRNWSEARDYVIGYFPQNEYYDWNLKQSSFDELAQRNILQGMDMIIWKLCKHFGFQMIDPLRVDSEEGHVIEADQIAPRPWRFPHIEWQWNEDDWSLPSWDMVWRTKWPNNDGIEVWPTGDAMILTGQRVVQICCPPHVANSK